MSTANVSVLRTGTGFTIDVTACNLLADLTIKDFAVLHGGVAIPIVSYTKTSRTILTYSGAALATDTPVEVRRRTPPNQVAPIVTYPTKFSSSLWNTEFDRIVRRAEEADLNGAGPGAIAASVAPIDEAFGATWDNDVIYAPTRNSLFDKFQVMAPLASPQFTGTPGAPTPDADDNSTRIATTAFVQGELSSYMPLGGGTFTGTVFGLTPTTGSNSTAMATTAFVKNQNYAQKTGANTFSQTNTFNGVTILNGPVDINGNTSLRVYNTTAISAPTTADTLVPFNTESFDALGEWDTTTHRFTPLRSGMYLFLIKLYGDSAAPLVINMTMRDAADAAWEVYGGSCYYHLAGYLCVWQFLQDLVGGRSHYLTIRPIGGTFTTPASQNDLVHMKIVRLN